MAFLEWRRVGRSYGGEPALQSVSLTLARGAILAVLGPSGCGKTTLLRVTAGLESPDEGVILCEQRDIGPVPPHRRGFGLMFQDYGLFPHLDVARNVGFGLRMQRVARRAAASRVQEMLSLVRLEGFARRGVHELSGGERQRVALARSLAPAPRLLMLDEPLAALDAGLRRRLLAELQAILREVGVTAIYVTHDREEALAVADRVAVMRAGRIVQAGTPSRLVSSPADSFVASFLELGAVVRASSVLCGSRAPLLLVRPEAVSLSERKGAVRVGARIVSRAPHPQGTLVRLQLQDGAEPAGGLEILCGGEAARRAARCGPGECSAWIDTARCTPLAR
jgi:ABC-type Fe3+/spermidine/putrescine transport system ATPase subunit